MMYIKNDLIKKNLVVLLKIGIFETSNQLKNYTTHLLENLKKENFTQPLWSIFKVLILKLKIIHEDIKKLF